MSRILITGATGFLGSALARRLVVAGHRVRILRRESSLLAALAGVEYETAIGDLRDAVAVSRAVRGCEIVFHSAALIQYWDHRNALQRAINVEGTRHVVDACLQHGVQRLIHVSSVAAVGYAPNATPIDETAAYNLAPFRLNYADTKHDAELLVRAGIARGLDAVIINPGTIYGPGDRRRAAYIRGLASPFTSSGGMSIVDVDDVVEGAIRAWQRGKTGERYLLTAENILFRDLGRIFAQHLHRTGPRIIVPSSVIRVCAALLTPIGRLRPEAWSLTPAMARVAHLTFFYSSAKAQRELGMVFRPVAETIARTVAWLREQGLV